MTELAVVLRAAEMTMAMQTGLIQLLAKIILSQEAEEIAEQPKAKRLAR